MLSILLLMNIQPENLNCIIYCRNIIHCVLVMIVVDCQPVQINHELLYDLFYKDFVFELKIIEYGRSFTAMCNSEYLTFTN